MWGARFFSLIGRAPESEKRRWSRHRTLGLVAGISAFAVVVSSLSPVGTDITMYWTAAHRIFEQGVDPYILQPGDRLLFVYPPTAFFLLYPFSALGIAQSTTLMLTVNSVIAVILMAMIVGDLACDDPSQRLVLWGPLYIAAFGGLYLNIGVFGPNRRKYASNSQCPACTGTIGIK